MHPNPHPLTPDRETIDDVRSQAKRRARTVENVILIDEADRIIGFQEKLAAHRNGGSLHRAFSIFIFNSSGEMLLQERSSQKYHFGGLWANACCGHPRPGEDLHAAAHRRLVDELGFDTMLRTALSFLYVADDPASGLTERELDHVLIGEFDGAFMPNPNEVDSVRWVTTDEIVRDLRRNGDCYAPWFHEAVTRLESLSQLP
jgi:isopentenyl-diphosphate delta-isomerase